MKRLNKKQFKKYVLPVSFFVVVFFIVLSNVAQADAVKTLKDALTFAAASPVLLALGAIAGLMTTVVGSLDTLVISAITHIVEYNDFITEPTIVQAWVIVRDLCNMFFVVILLIIAFASILRYENYSIQKTLPKLLIMAVLINFSRMICGLFIDISQVVMLTFVNSWGNNGSGFITMSGMAKFFTSSTFDGFGGDGWSLNNVIAAYIIGIGFLLVIGVALVATLGVFLMRMILLWVYVIFSPAAFLLSAFPAGRTYAGKWVSGFTQQLVAGPILAFFLWLAMIIAQAQIFGSVTTGDSSQAICASVTDITCIRNFLPFIISIGVMMAGLMAAQSAGGMAGGAASWGMSKIRQGKAYGLKKANIIARDTGTRYTGYAAKGAGGILGIGAAKDSTRYKMGQFLGGAGSNVIQKQRDAKTTKRYNALKKFGLKDENIEALGTAADSKLGRSIKSIGGLGMAGAGVATANVPLMAAGGVVAAGSLVGGQLKNWASVKTKKREEQLEEIERFKNEAIASIREDKAYDLEDLEHRKKDPDIRIRESEKYKNEEIKKAKKLRDSMIKRYGEAIDKNPESAEYYNRRIKKAKTRYNEKEEKLNENHNNILTNSNKEKISDSEYESEKERINDLYKQKENEFNESYNVSKKNIEASEMKVEKFINKNYKPNRVMVEAGEKAGKDTNTAKERLDTIKKGEDAAKMSASTFYSPSGMTNVQKRFFDHLTADNKGSRQAIENMTKVMEKYANEELTLGNKEINTIRALKQGMAGYKKDGNSIEVLSKLKDVLNSIPNHTDSNHPNVNSSVEDYESTVIV
jgi:hypothetical protein